MYTGKLNQKIKVMEKDRLYAKLVALAIIFEKGENCRQPFVERLIFRKGEHQEVLDKITDPQFRQWVASIKLQL